MRIDLKSLLILAGVSVLVASATFATTVIFMPRQVAPAAAALPEPASDPTLFTEPYLFTVNLSGQGRTPYLRVGIVFYMSNKRALEELTRRAAEVQDRVISVLRAKVPDDFRSENLDRVKQELRAAVTPVVQRIGSVSNLYFTELVIQ